MDSDKFSSYHKYLDFKDVLVLPRFSNINSRSEVNLCKKINFKKWFRMEWNSYYSSEYDNNRNI